MSLDHWGQALITAWFQTGWFGWGFTHPDAAIASLDPISYLLCLPLSRQQHSLLA